MAVFAFSALFLAQRCPASPRAYDRSIFSMRCSEPHAAVFDVNPAPILFTTQVLRSPPNWPDIMNQQRRAARHGAKLLQIPFNLRLNRAPLVGSRETFQPETPFLHHSRRPMAAPCWSAPDDAREHFRLSCPIPAEPWGRRTPLTPRSFTHYLRTVLPFPVERSRNPWGSWVPPIGATSVAAKGG